MRSTPKNKKRCGTAWKRIKCVFACILGACLVAAPLVWNLKSLVQTSVQLESMAQLEDDAPRVRPVSSRLESEVELMRGHQHPIDKTHPPKIQKALNSTHKDALKMKPPSRVEPKADAIQTSAPLTKKQTADIIQAPPPVKAAPAEGSQHTKVWKTLEEVISILNTNKVDYFLMAGSLLGFARSNDTKPWLDSDIDLAVSTTWMNTPGNLERIHKQFTNAGFEWKMNHTGVDDTVASLGGAIVYEKSDIEVELVATDVTPNFHVNGFRHETYRLGCPKPQVKIKSLPWGSLAVRAPMPFHQSLRATYGDHYNQPVSQTDYEASRMTDVTTSGKCMIVKNTQQSKQPKPRFHRGIVACLTDRESVAQAFILAKKMSQFHPQVPLELHHLGTLSYHLQARLELYPFVTVVDLQTMSRGPFFNLTAQSSSKAKCNYRALQTTKLRHVLWVRPSIQFLYNPHYILQTVEYVDEQDSKCQAILEGNASCITSTDSELTLTIADVPHNPRYMHLVRTYPNHSLPTLLLNSTSLVVATVHQVSDGVGVWIHPSSNYSRWATSDLFQSTNPFVWAQQDLPSGASIIPTEYHDALQSYWEHYLEAKRIILLDRPIDWVAFDTGLFWKYSTMHSQKAANESHHERSPIQTIDVTVSADKEMIATHNNEEFTSFPFEGNKLPAPISSTDAATIKNWTNPCVPEATARLWLYDNPYQPFHCSPEKVSPQDDFMIYSIDAEAVYDLKAPSKEAQVEEAKSIVELFQTLDDTLLENGQVSVRFFDVTQEQKLTTAVLPEHAEKALASDPSIRQLAYYVNAPSVLACTQLVNWIHYHALFANKNVLGCFVIMNHEATASSWESFRSKNKIPHDAVTMPPPSKSGFPSPKTICDIPRKQDSPNRTMWMTSHIACIEAGFEYIQHPWFIPMYVDFSRLPSGIESVDSTLQSKLFKSIIPSRLQESTNQTDPSWASYLSHWGFVHQSDWHNRHGGWFQGARNQTSVTSSSSAQLVSFRCITKVLVTMLFLRLEELGLMSLDDPLRLNGNPSNVDNISHKSTTWRHVLSGSAGAGGKHAGTKFEYDSDMWQHASELVESTSGLNFTNAMQHHILDPMGVEGKFDQYTPHTPYISRGFMGPLEDLLVIGSTLVSFGVSPKTRRQVISAGSVERLLNNTVLEYDPTRVAFYNDTVVKSMKRFRDPRRSRSGNNSLMPRKVIDGYGMGIWCVLGWRHTQQGDPIRGWIALGSSEALIYFDVTGMVLVFHSPTRTMGYELTTAFANIVRDAGDVLSELALTSLEVVQVQ